MKKNMTYILVANILYLFIGLISSFVLPKFLSVDSYSYLKTFALFVGYAGVLQLGYADGMYLFYGGKNYKSIDSKTISIDINNYVILNTVIGLSVLVVSIIVHSTIGLIISIGMLCDNLLGFFRSFYQAIGEFKNYGLALNIQKFSVLLIQLLLVFAFHSDNYIHYALTTIAVTFGCALYFYVALSKKKTIRLGLVSIQRAKLMVSQGIVLLIGNFANLLFTSLDRWFIKALLANLQFAQYSFAVSAESLINALISPVTVTFYNAFCKDSTPEYVKKSKNISMVIGVFAISTVYPIIWVTRNYLPKYEEATIPLIFLFGAHAFYSIVKGVYVNLYKVNKQQNKYLKQLIELIVIAAALNGLIYAFYRKMDSFAIATFITAVLWFLICELQNPCFRFGVKEYIFLGASLLVYFLTNYLLNEIVGFIVYLFSGLMLLKILLPHVFNEIVGLFQLVKNRIVR